MFTHTVAITRCLIAEGRLAEVEDIILPLLQMRPAQDRALTADESERLALLRCLLAQAWLLDGKEPGKALDLLKPVTTCDLSSPPALSEVLARLWTGYACLRSDSDRDQIPRAIHLLKTSQVQLELMERGDYLYWAHLGLALAYSRLGERAQVKHLTDRLTVSLPFTHDALARAWAAQIGTDNEALSNGSSGDRYFDRTTRNGAQAPNDLYASYTALPLLNQCRTIAAGSAPVLITGERGAGKEAAARLIHDLMGLAQESFACIDCEVISSMQQTDIFSFTSGGKPGSPPRTLLLNHVEKLHPISQNSLLDYVRAHTLAARVGQADAAEVPPAPRLLAATSANLEALVERGAFSRALYFLLQINALAVPPLRSRKMDIPLLATHYARQFCPIGVPFVAITEEAVRAMMAYSWPGNVRQLRNEIERATVMVAHEPVPVIDRKILSRTIQSGSPAPSDGAVKPDVLPDDAPLDDLLASTEKRIIEEVLASNQGQVSVSATRLGLTRQGLYKKIKRLGISVAKFQKEPGKESSALLR